MEEASKTGKWMPAKVVRWIDEKAYGFINADGGARVRSLDLREWGRRRESSEERCGKFKAVAVNREYDCMEDVAQKNWRKRRQRR